MEAIGTVVVCFPNPIDFIFNLVLESLLETGGKIGISDCGGLLL